MVLRVYDNNSQPSSNVYGSVPYIEPPWFGDWTGGVLGGLPGNAASPWLSPGWQSVPVAVPNVPLGPGNFPVQPTGLGLPPMVSSPAAPPPPPVPGPTITQGNGGSIMDGPTIWQGSDQSFNDLLQAGVNVVRPAGWGQPQQLQQPTSGEDEVSFIEDGYNILDTALGGILPGGVPFGTGNVIQAIGNPPAVAQQGLPQPTVTQMPNLPAQGNCDNDPYRGLVYKKVCGQYRWVKPSRRRRRRVATQQQVKDIAAMKGVLGNGKALETWIATHS